MTREEIEENIIRAEMCSEVTVPGGKWRGVLKLALSSFGPRDATVITLSESLSREKKAADAAFASVLAAAERIYQEEIESDPSDYFFTKKAVEEAKEQR